jgi:hypothetical protein
MSNLGKLQNYYINSNKLKQKNNYCDKKNYLETVTECTHTPNLYVEGQFIVMSPKDAIQKKKLLESEFLGYDEKLKTLVEKFRKIAVKKKSFVTGVGLKVDLLDKSDIQLMHEYFDEKAAIHALKLKNLGQQKFLTKVIEAYAVPKKSITKEEAKKLLNNLIDQEKLLEKDIIEITNKILSAYRGVSDFDISKGFIDSKYKMSLDYLNKKAEIIEKKNIIKRKIIFLRDFLKIYNNVQDADGDASFNKGNNSDQINNPPQNSKYTFESHEYFSDLKDSSVDLNNNIKNYESFNYPTVDEKVYEENFNPNFINGVLPESDKTYKKLLDYYTNFALISIKNANKN